MKKALHVNYPEFEIDSVIDEDLEKELSKITYDKITSSSTSRTIKNIRKNLSATLKAKYDINDTEKLNEITSKILKIHGLHEDNFDFVKKFEDGLLERINDFSIDDNSNKNEKVMRGYLNEVEKPVDKLIGYDVLYRTLKDLYGEKEAKRLTGEMYDYSLGLSDSSNVLVPYSYYKHTPILVRCNGIEKYMSLNKLYNAYKDNEEYIEKYDMYQIDMNNLHKNINIKPVIMNGHLSRTLNRRTIDENIKISENHNIEVWDNNSNKWVKISRMVRHKNDRDFIIYQTNSGHFAFVTEDHPVILNDMSEVQAKDLKIGDEVLINYNVPDFTQYINVPNDLAYFMGFVCGDGNIQCADVEDYNIFGYNGCAKFKRNGNTITIYQKDIMKSRIYETVLKLFPNANIFYFNNDEEKSGNVINFSSPDFINIYATYFDKNYRENSCQKCLPSNIIHWNNESILSYVAGLIDSDGSVWKDDGRCKISLKNPQIINILYDLLNKIEGINGIFKNAYLDNPNDLNTLMFNISFNPRDNEFLVNMCEKLSKLKNCDPDLFNKKWKKQNKKEADNSIKRIIRFNRNELKNTNMIYNELDEVLDITTETGKFYANGMVQHNCWALDASKLVTQGRNFGVLPSKPCKRVSSYISSLCETIHQMSNHLAGAIAVGTFFLDLTHILIYKERRTLNEIKTDKKLRKYVENELQQFIHSVNHLSRNGAESPFTNVSIFDSVKLKGLIDKDNYAWYFPNLKAISTDNDLDDKMSDEEFNQYVIDYILTVQNLYIDFFEKGDPLNNGMPYRFPVSTVNFSKKKENDELIIEDSKFLKEFRKHDVFRFNLFNSMGTKICSCCFNGDEVIEIENKSGEKTITSIQDFVNIYSNNNEGEYDVNDEIFIKSLDENNEMTKSKIIGVLNKKNGYNEMIDIEVGDHKISVTPDHIFKVKDKITNDIKEITAEELLNNKEKYMVPVI